MAEVYATCGHVLTPEEGVGDAFWLYDGGELSWLAYCKACKDKLTPIYVYDIRDFQEAKHGRGLLP